MDDHDICHHLARIGSEGGMDDAQWACPGFARAWLREYHPMHTAVPTSIKVRRIILWVEWLLILHCVFENLMGPDFFYLSYGYWRLGLFVPVITALSLYLPTQRSLNQRRLYIAVEMAVLVLASCLRLNTSALDDLAIIKACLLLPGLEVIATAVISDGLMLGHFGWILPTLIDDIRARNLDVYLDSQRIWTGAVVGAVVNGIFVILLGFVFAAEQRSRRRAEQLALEVESLATKLERSRIARDIHDSLGHSLTTLDVQLALAERYSQGTRNPKLQQALDSAKQLAAQCLAEARQSLQTIRESNFDLDSALRTLGEQMRPSFLVNLQVQVPSLPQQLSYQLYLIAKEGLVNVQKHAVATKVNLSLVATKGELVLTLVDDGCGFDVGAVINGQQSSQKSGYGLQGIRERSQLLGGQMKVDSSPEKGCVLQVILPLRWPEKQQQMDLVKLQRFSQA
ncbi:MAG: sensor histidine kinase [Phormidesmis sp.]